MINPDTDDFGTIEMWLTRGSALAEWTLVNARLRYAQHSTRLLFEDTMCINQAFIPEIANLLVSHLEEVHETAVFSHSEFVHDLPTLQLEGLRVLTHMGENGSASANVRFVRAVGDLGAVFLPPYGGSPQPTPDLEDITVPVLQELLYPALEVFDHILEHGLSDDQAKLLTARVKTMRAKRDELSDYITLLTRYVEAMSVRKQSRLPVQPEAHQQALELSAKTGLPAADIRWSPKEGVVRGMDSDILHAKQNGTRNDGEPLT